MNYISNYHALIALHQIQGIGWQSIERLISIGWQPDNLDVRPFLSRAKLRKDQVEKITRVWNPEYVQGVISSLKASNISVITKFDYGYYSSYLSEIAKPPWVLYARGDLSLLNQPAIAVIGTRKITPYGRRTTQKLVQELICHDLVIVSGMALGVDGQAHRSALLAGGKTIAVLGTGVDIVYPKSHAELYSQIIERGLIISEMPPGTAPLPGLFPQRNRIISGLSLGVLVTEASDRSGSLITSQFALEQGREVFALPGPIDSTQSVGANELIQHGAKCVLSLKDILDELPTCFGSSRPQSHLYCESGEPNLPKTQTDSSKDITLSELEQQVMSLINDSPTLVDDILGAIDDQISISNLHVILLSLELKGCIVQQGGFYSTLNSK